MKRGTVIAFLFFALTLMIALPASADVTLTFEEFLGHDGAPISTFYSGITFQAVGSGHGWVAADETTGRYHSSSWPSGEEHHSGEFWIYDHVSAWMGGASNAGTIGFDNEDATFVELGYAANTVLYLEAYDSSGFLLDSDSAPGNLRYANNNSNGPGTLRVGAPVGQYISYVIVHDSGNSWVVDNIWTDSSGITTNPVPVPAAALLCGIGVGITGWLRRRRIL